MRAGHYYFNRIARAYFKYLVETCLELYRKQISKTCTSPVFQYIKRLAKHNQQFVVNPKRQGRSQVSRQLSDLKLHDMFSLCETIDPNRLRWNNGDLLYQPIDCQVAGPLNLSQRTDANRKALVTLFRIQLDEDFRPKIDIVTIDP
jgi:hypothetical protein